MVLCSYRKKFKGRTHALPDDSLLDLAEYISEKLGCTVIDHKFEKDELVLQVKPDEIVNALQFLRDDRECAFSTLIDITAVDYPNRVERFDVVYSLLSMRQNNRARVKISIEDEQIIPTATGAFSSALWYEREVWDMYGIMFADNPDLRRILTDYGFEGHPQRKDFPLTGYVELRYDDEQKRVVYEPVKLTQDFRNFDYLSPWEGLTDVQLPGDEKGAIPPHGWDLSNDDKQGANQEDQSVEEEGEDHASNG